MQNVVWMVFTLLILLVVYRNTNAIAGWSRADAYILVATSALMGALHQAFFFSLPEIPEQVRLGTLDFVIVKPVDSMFWVSVRKFNFDQIGNLIAGFVMVAYGIGQLGTMPSIAQWLGYTSLLLSSVFIFYAINLAMMTTGIWLVKVENLWVLSELLGSSSRNPVDIFGSTAKRVLTFVIPLAFLATVPAEQLVRGFDPKLVGLGLVWAVVLVGASRQFWNFAMKSYSSASS